MRAMEGLTQYLSLTWQHQDSEIEPYLAAEPYVPMSVR